MLQPETTTTSGARVLERAEHVERDRIVVAEDAVRAGNAPAVEDDRAVSRVRRPGPALDAAPGVDRGQLELGAIRGTVEHRRPIGRRLGQDEGDIDRGVRARPEPRPRGDLLGARLVSCPQPPEPVDGERRIEPQRPCREPRTVAARHTCPGERPRCGPPRLVAPVAALEPLDEPSEGVRRRSHGPVGQRKARAGEPGELCSASSSSGTRAAICRSATRRWHSRWSAARRADACVSCLRYRTSASWTLSPSATSSSRAQRS